jgi:hypothetical protein
MLAALLALTISARGDESAGYSYWLFDGKHIDRFVVTNCEVAVENGALRLVAGNGLVRSQQAYADFVLELQWRALNPDRYDSGIYFRAPLPAEGKPWPARYQANLLKGQEGNVGGLPGAKSAGLVKPGEWNHFRLTCIGDRAELEMNGQPAWKVAGLEARSGFIGLQAEVPGGGQFEFKDIRITELGYQALFNGRDLSGWEGGNGQAQDCWKVVDGLLMCTGQRGPWLRSKDQYGDFNLRLEYKLKPAGNSGVYVRVPENGDHRGREVGQNAAGVEIQILDDQAERYAGLKPYQFSASVYAIAPATMRVSLPAGSWNSLEIDCRGPRYRVIHNGHTVVDAAPEEFPELNNRLLKGYLGLQNHSEEVWFTNLRIGPAMP